jgi:hypothetical protein
MDAEPFAGESSRAHLDGPPDGIAKLRSGIRTALAFRSGVIGTSEASSGGLHRCFANFQPDLEGCSLGGLGFLQLDVPARAGQRSWFLRRNLHLRVSS